MTVPGPDELEDLIERAGRGDAAAREDLLARHQDRLRRMVAVRLDRRLAPRVDASDVVQEALAEAGRDLSTYLRDRPVAFYPWLRHIAWKRLIDMHRHHLNARKRSVAREEAFDLPLPDHSALQLADRFIDSGTSPSLNLIRDEQRQRLTAGMSRLAARDREILVMRYLEQMAFDEIAGVLGLNAGAVKMRHMRALDRLRRFLADEGGDSVSAPP